jgi:hypothetical protein
MQRRRWMRRLCVIALAVSIARCERGSDPFPALQNASSLIEQAESTGAAQVAAADLERARHLLRNAEAAHRIGRSTRASRLAHEASVEARLAIARTAAVRANEAVPPEPPAVAAQQ